MDAKAAKLAMIALAYGAERIPDKVFDAIPGHYFKAKEDSVKERGDRQHQRSLSSKFQKLREPDVVRRVRAHSASDHSHKFHSDRMSRDHHHHPHSNGHGTYQKYYTTEEPSRRYDDYYAPESRRNNQLVSTVETLLFS